MIDQHEKAFTLNRWERYYLTHQRHGFVSIPKQSKVAHMLMDKDIISTLGFVVGRYVEYQLTPNGYFCACELSAGNEL